MSNLPSEEALREMRALCEDRSYSGEVFCTQDILALLDCALLMRRLERWTKFGMAEIDPMGDGRRVAQEGGNVSERIWTAAEITSMWPQARGELRNFALHLQRSNMGLTGAQLGMALDLADKGFALAGIPDPQAAIEAAREALNLAVKILDPMHPRTANECRAALALLETKP